jgi:hypothetical protein
MRDGSGQMPTLGEHHFRFAEGGEHRLEVLPDAVVFGGRLITLLPVRSAFGR